MPIIQFRRDDYELTQRWPDSMMVQWGGAGIVLSKAPYRTAFFECFPSEGGFIRGEGETIQAAELAAFNEWRRGQDCEANGGHRWSRTKHGKKPITYTNGGCFCIRCGIFASKMKPIVKLGEWRQPLSVMSLQIIAMGTCRQADKYAVNLKLKAKANGIDLPDDNDIDYVKKCHIAVGRFFRDHKDRISTEGGDGLSGFMESMAMRFLESNPDE